MFDNSKLLQKTISNRWTRKSLKVQNFCKTNLAIFKPTIFNNMSDFNKILCIMPMEMEIYIFKSNISEWKNCKCSSKLKIFLHTESNFLFWALKMFTFNAYFFKKICGGLRPSAPPPRSLGFARYYNPIVFRFWPPLFKKLDPPLAILH